MLGKRTILEIKVSVPFMVSLLLCSQVSLILLVILIIVITERVFFIILLMIGGCSAPGVTRVEGIDRWRVEVKQVFR